MKLFEVAQKEKFELVDVIEDFPDNYEKFIMKLGEAGQLLYRGHDLGEAFSLFRRGINDEVQFKAYGTTLFFAVPDFTVDGEEFTNLPDLAVDFSFTDIEVKHIGYIVDHDSFMLLAEGDVAHYPLLEGLEDYFKTRTGHDFSGDYYDSKLWNELLDQLKNMSPVPIAMEAKIEHDEPRVAFLADLSHSPRLPPLEAFRKHPSYQNLKIIWFS